MKKKIIISVCVIAAAACSGIVIAMFVRLLSGYKGYSVKNVDLYTVATNSVLWNTGHSHGADFITDPKIKILEKDNYGRTMFVYQEKYYSGGQMSFSALLVSQYSADGFVYYYEDCNYIIKQKETLSSNFEKFGQEEIDNLKALNDWGKEINVQKCIKQEINKKKKSIPRDGQIIKQKAIDKFELADDNNLFLDYLTCDAKGNFIAYGTVSRKADPLYFAVFVKNDGTDMEFLVPENLYAYQRELADFKQANGWAY